MKFSHRMNLGSAVVAASLLLVTPNALAHARPKVMVPAADSTGPSPAKISITFSEAVEPKFSSLKLTDESKNTQFNTMSSKVIPGDPKTLTLALPSLKPGSYLVHWVSVAVDGHRLEGEYKFKVQ